MKRRSNFFSSFSTFRALMKTQHSAINKSFRCDLDGEYTSNAFTTLLASDGIIRQTACPNSRTKWCY